MNDPFISFANRALSYTWVTQNHTYKTNHWRFTNLELWVESHMWFLLPCCGPHSGSCRCPLGRLPEYWGCVYRLVRTPFWSTWTVWSAGCFCTNLQWELRQNNVTLHECKGIQTENPIYLSTFDTMQFLFYGSEFFLHPEIMFSYLHTWWSFDFACKGGWLALIYNQILWFCGNSWGLIWDLRGRFHRLRWPHRDCKHNATS